MNAKISLWVIHPRLEMVTSNGIDDLGRSLGGSRLEVDGRPGVGQVSEHKIRSLDFQNDSVIDVIVVFDLIDPVRNDVDLLQGASYLFEQPVGIRIAKGNGYKATQACI